jgi:hypothetical protein
MPASNYRVTQLACRGEAAIFDGDDDSLSSVECGPYLARVGVVQPRARRAAMSIGFRQQWIVKP